MNEYETKVQDYSVSRHVEMLNPLYKGLIMLSFIQWSAHLGDGKASNIEPCKYVNTDALSYARQILHVAFMKSAMQAQAAVWGLPLGEQ